MTKPKESRKHKKQRKQQHSKRRGLIAFYAKRLREESEELEKKQRAEAAAKAATKVAETTSMVQTSAGQFLKNNPDLAEWTQSRKTVLQKKRKDAMDRWTMATSGGKFKGR